MGVAGSKLNIDRGAIVEAIIGNDPRKQRNLARLENTNQTLDTNLGLKPIHLAITADNYDAVKQLVSNSQTDVNSRFQDLPCLSLAAIHSTVQIVKELLKRRDLNVNAVAGQSRITALMAAVHQGPDERSQVLRAQIVEVIVSDPRCEAAIVDKNNYTALTYAAHLGYALVVKTLLQNGRAVRYDVDELIGDCGVAMANGHEAICDLILESLTSEQRASLLQKLNLARAASAQRENAENMLALLSQANALLGAAAVVGGSEGDSRKHVDGQGKEIKVGSVVRLPREKEINLDVLKQLQLGHGGWTDEMTSLILGRQGIITSFDKDGDVVVNFLFMQSPTKKLEFTLNPKIVKLSSKDDYIGSDRNGNPIKKGDVIKVLDNEGVVQAVQDGHGGWSSRTKDMLGKHGKIIFLDLDGDVWVTIATHTTCFSPKAIILTDSVQRSDGSPVRVGDTVTITSSRSDFERLQTLQFGGWNSKMEAFLGKTAIVKSIECNAFFETDMPQCMVQVHVAVTSASSVTCSINPKAIASVVEKADSSVGSSVGDSATVMDSAGLPIRLGSAVSFVKDPEKVRQLQAGRKGWSDKLFTLFVKLPVLVTAIKSDGDIEVAGLVFVTGDQDSVITVNPKAVVLRSKDGYGAADHDGKIVSKGDTVNLLDSEAELRNLQNAHGGWSDAFRPFLGKPIVVQFFDRDGDIVAILGGFESMASFNPKATKKVDKVLCLDNTEASIGSTVRVTVTAAEFERLQTDQFGGWSPSLVQLLNQTATVKAISCKFQVKTTSPACVIKVELDGRAFWINPLAVKTESGSTGGSSSGRQTDDDHRDLRVIPFEQITLEKKLGQGGFGTVWLSKWIATRCAVKQIQANDIIAGAERDRILQEAVTHSRLIHPHIVQFLGISLQPTFMYIVLKCVDGFNLDEIIFERKMTLTDDDKRAITTQVCDVIRFLHYDARPKVIHQDIKPSNVLVESGTKQALVTDFGISRLAGFSPTDSVTNLTKVYSTSLCGTIMYMAPELIKPNAEGLHKKPNFQSDIFALGGTLAEFLSTRRLYGDHVRDMSALLALKINASETAPFAVDHVPTRYRALLKRCLSHQPVSRPTALELVKGFSV